jgi:phosphatidylserine/phosphatidylglycerophosphate/cardiolipin synthase-like enzyme
VYQRRHRRRWWQIALLAAVALLVWHGLARNTPGVVAQLPRGEPAAAADDRLIIEPDAGLPPIYSLLASAHRTLDMTMYELVDPSAEAVLADDAARGVRVRVILDHRLEGSRNLPAYDFLRSRGVQVEWSSGRFFATHQKTFVVDDATAVVMSLNLTERYYATSRDAAVVDHDRHDVEAIESVFDADLRGAATAAPAADDLVWSPDQSQADFLALIAGAHRSIAVESEELSSRAVTAALLGAVRRGVAVSVSMTYNSEAIPALNELAAAGATVSLLHGETPLYIHAKLLAVDAGMSTARAFVGSENFSDASLLHDRELGIVLVAPHLVDQVAATISADVTTGQRWR